MHRRALLTLPLIAVPAARAQSQRTATVGVLAFGPAGPLADGLREALRTQGFVDGRNLLLLPRSAEGDPALALRIAREFVDRRVDVIVVSQTPTVIAASQATATIPIVMAGTADPVGLGFVRSLASPGGNITGTTATTSSTSIKTLELLLSLVPSLRSVAAFANAEDPFGAVFERNLRAAARTLGVQLHVTAMRTGTDVAAAVGEAVRSGAQALVAQPTAPRELVRLALSHRLPTVSASSAWIAEGALMSYGADLQELIVRTAHSVARVLRGARPADLPVEEPSRFELVLNLRTARALGLAVPATVLLQASRVVE